MAEAEGWRVMIGRRAKRVMARLPADVNERIDWAIRALAGNPRPAGCVKLKGHDILWRIRVGDWRVTYAIKQEQLAILIIEVSPRGGAYRNL